ncbi:MAG: damage-control phosphatase ARMT1 family protein [Candidatus Helarchaeota archaeon]
MDKDKKLWTRPGCASCLTKIALDMIQRSTEDEDLKRELVREMYGKLQDISSKTLTVELANEMLEIIEDKTGCPDPFIEEKKQSNEIGTQVAARIRKVISSGKTEEHLRDAIFASIIGNIIDFATGDHEVELDSEALFTEFKKIKEHGLDLDDTAQLFDLMKDGKKRILYCLDNAGEVAFDKILIEFLVSLGNEIFLVVKDAPYSNDCTVVDARQVNLDEVPNSTIIPTARFCLGFTKNNPSPEFLKALDEADLVISKGQNNFETFAYYRDEKGIKIPILYVFRAKCEPLARFWKVEVGANICAFHSRLLLIRNERSF